MFIGIIAEGNGDCAVLDNILLGILGVNYKRTFLRPRLFQDSTDLEEEEKKGHLS